ncbi:pilus biosynthesis protein CpaE [Glutamicibacter uratoxydans]|uniref:Pilus biosynthesis protein CpaE n=1 Tax=Glutamicibacter uratoxydans TaxID=43667 RepID=A0A4Y4DT43_GLUUR|nr:chromosome partitioning protein [Glutamicibacter uratoxydans]GED07064.1 pilus biosynthesis protein CpaE [Glutamicibacter uratoxydans]
MSLTVVILGREEHLVREVEGYRGELIVVRVCDEVPEAIAVCTVEAVDVLLIAQRSLVPPPEQLDDLKLQRTVVVLRDADPQEQTAESGLIEVADNISMIDLEARILHAQEFLHGHHDLAHDAASAQTRQAQEHQGRMVCFWGASGSPGRSTLALNYAVEAAAQGQSVVIVDADTYAASIAIQLGLMDESASIAQICRVADSGAADPARLKAACMAVQVGGFVIQVATGIPRASRWPEVRAAALRRAIQALRSHHDMVVVDVAACIELDEQLSFDTQAPQRNAVTVEMLQCADEIFMVVAADSLGIPRAIRALDELEERVPGIEVKIIFNKVAVANSGRSPKRRVEEAWERFGPTHLIVGFLPNDNAVCSAAILAGSPLLEIAPKSSLRASIRQLAGIKSTDSSRKGASRRFERSR